MIVRSLACVCHTCTPDGRAFARPQPHGVDEPNPDARVKLQWTLTKLERAEGGGAGGAGGGGGGYVASYTTPEGPRTVRARAVVSTAPAHALRDVLAPVMPSTTSAVFDKIRFAAAAAG